MTWLSRSTSKTRPSSSAAILNKNAPSPTFSWSRTMQRRKCELLMTLQTGSRTTLLWRHSKIKIPWFPWWHGRYNLKLLKRCITLWVCQVVAALLMSISLIERSRKGSERQGSSNLVLPRQLGLPNLTEGADIYRWETVLQCGPPRHDAVGPEAGLTSTASKWWRMLPTISCDSSPKFVFSWDKLVHICPSRTLCRFHADIIIILFFK